VATILVVDDEPDIRMFVRFTVEADHHDVVEAGNGRAALDAVSAVQPDLVVLDVLMPELSGWDVLEQLKVSDDERIRETPVVMLTALSSPMDRARGGIEGAVRYLAKPIGMDELRAAVADSLAGDPEPTQRLRAQRRALEDLARMERGDEADADIATTAAPRPRLSGLENARSVRTSPEPAPAVTPPGIDELTGKQRELLEAVRDEPTVLAAAARLGTSRSNVYASLRRIARRLEIRDVSDLLTLIRTGRLLD
jgi:CheY-like chemotaxis protein